MHRSLPRFTRALAAVAGVVAVASCGSDEPGNSVKDYFSAVQAVVTTANAPVAPASAFRPSIGAKTKGNRPLFSVTPTQTVNATFHSGTPPTSGDGPSVTSASEGSTPFLGQPLRYQLSGSSAFSKIYLWVDGVDGYYELDLPVSLTLVQLVLQMTDNAGSSFDLQTALSGTGGVGAVNSETITTRDPNDSDIFVTLTWTGQSDVDLHVTDPHGVEIYYANDRSPEGGALDLDSNAGCDIDNINQETISWPNGTAPSGHYKVVVDYYDDCGVSSSGYDVTVKKNGNTIDTFSGSFNGAAANNSPATAAEFDF